LSCFVWQIVGLKMLLEADALKYFHKIFHFTDKLKISPLLFNKTKQRFESSNAKYVRPTSILNLCLLFLGALLVGVILLVSTELHNKKLVSTPFWIYWNLMTILAPSTIYISTIFFSYNDEILYNLNFLLKLIYRIQGNRITGCSVSSIL